MYNSISLRRPIGVLESLDNSTSRIRSPSGVLPGSRQTTTSSPRPRSASSNKRTCVDLPTPSMPSKEKNM